MQNYSPFFGNEDGSISYTVSGIKPKTTNTTFYDSKDVYPNADLASSRAYNIGCSGYRAVITNANGQYSFSPCTNSADYKKIMKDGILKVDNSQYKIMKRSLSNVIFRDPVKEGILSYFERVVYGLIETTKQIKNFFNYTVKKNNRRVF